MSQRTGRRQFLQSIAATAAAATTGCQGGEGGTEPVTGEASTSGAHGGSPGSAAGGVGAAQDSMGGVLPSGAGGNAPQPTGDAAGGSGEAVGGRGNSAGGSGASAEGADTASGGTPESSGGGNTASGGSSPSSGGSAGSVEPEPSGGASGGANVQPPPISSPVGVALLGLGSYASGRLAPALQLTEHCRLVGIVTGTPSKVSMWQQQYGIEDKNVYSYDNVAELIDNPDIHVVYVVTPNHVHAEFVIAAARARKHVWCEKPMAMNPEECQSMIDACAENGVGLSIGYRLQHEPNTQSIVEYASSMPFGAIQEVEALAGFQGFGPADADVWRLKQATGGGALYDMGVYSINAARYATGEEPIRVMNASQWTDRPDLFTEVDEWTEFDLEFPSGVIAHCRTSFGEQLDSLDVLCESGSYRLSPMQAYEGVSGEASDGTQLNQTIENQQAKQMDDDALALLEQRAVLVPGEEGLRDVRIVQAIQEAARTGQTVEL